MLTNLKFRMLICASFEFLEFQILINLIPKFNVQCCSSPILVVFSSMSKHQLAGKRTLTIEEKIKFLDANKKTRQSCRQLADQFQIEKTAAAKTSICQEYELFKGNLKRNRKEQFHKINEILYKWFKKCSEANIYPDGQMLKENGN